MGAHHPLEAEFVATVVAVEIERSVAPSGDEVQVTVTVKVLYDDAPGSSAPQVKIRLSVVAEGSVAIALGVVDP